MLAASPISLTLIAFSLIALWRRSLWLTSVLCLTWAAWAVHILFDSFMNRALFTAQKIGCIGTTNTYLILASLLCFTILVMTLKQRRKALPQ